MGPARPSFPAGRGGPPPERRGHGRQTGGKSLPDGRLPKPCGSLCSIRRATCRCFTARSSFAPRPRRDYFGTGAVEAEAVHVNAVPLLCFRSAANSRSSTPLRDQLVDRGPVAEALRQSAPLAVALQDLQEHVDEDDVRNPHVPR